jgi:hypothetical protein
MWVLLEGASKPSKIKADISEVLDLEDFKYVLMDEFEILRNAGQQNIVFFTIHDPETLLPPSARLHPFAGNTTDQEPLVIWHPLSNINSK